MDPEGNTKNFNYNEFMTKANTMTFTKAEMSMGTTVIDVKGSYSEKGKDVTSPFVCQIRKRMFPT